VLLPAALEFAMVITTFSFLGLLCALLLQSIFNYFSKSNFRLKIFCLYLFGAFLVFVHHKIIPSCLIVVRPRSKHPLIIYAPPAGAHSA